MQNSPDDPNLGNNLLTSVDLFDFLLVKLDAGSRSQIKVTVLPQLVNSLTSITALLKDDILTSQITDLINAVNIIKDSGVSYMSAEMKSTIVDGIRDLRSEVCSQIFDFYSEHDFEPTEQLIKTMTGVVKTCLESGKIKPSILED